MRKLLLFIFILNICSVSKAWNDNQSAGARSLGMAGSSVVLTDVYGLFNNQASLGFLKSFNAGTYYQNNFMVNGLSNKCVGLALPTNVGSFGLAVNSFGIKSYSENKIGLAYGRAFGKNFSFGLQLNYMRTIIGDVYGSGNAISAELGAIAKLNNKISVGAHLFNPTKAKITQFNNEKAPTIYRLGFKYTISKKLFITAEGEKNSQIHNPVFKAGLEYLLYKNIFLRTGVSNNPVLNSFGVGMNLNQFKADLGIAYNSGLGIISGLSLSYILEKKKTNSKQGDEEE